MNHAGLCLKKKHYTVTVVVNDDTVSATTHTDAVHDSWGDFGVRT